MTPRDTCVECHGQQHSALIFPHDVYHILETISVSLPKPHILLQIHLEEAKILMLSIFVACIIGHIEQSSEKFDVRYKYRPNFRITLVSYWITQIRDLAQWLKKKVLAECLHWGLGTETLSRTKKSKLYYQYTSIDLQNTFTLIALCFFCCQPKNSPKTVTQSLPWKRKEWKS